jgi:hypothetical protein
MSRRTFLAGGGFPTSQRMASIALTFIGCIIYLALGNVLTCAMFCRRQRERNWIFFFPAKKAQEVHRKYKNGHFCKFICVSGHQNHSFWQKQITNSQCDTKKWCEGGHHLL